MLDNFLSGHKFAEISDFVYATVVNDGSKKHAIYPLNINLLEDGDILYCKTDYIISLFNIIKGVNKKIGLITHESDYSITKEIFDLRPKCIDKWYAINVEYLHEDLIPIPLGLANDYCNITLKLKDLQFKKEQKKLLYINHRVETNINAREWIYKHFQTNEWCTVKQANLSFQEYKKDLSEHKFMLCPRGNGIDTHRIWECLYAGLIPIVENHLNYRDMRDLPILFIESFKEINFSLLNNFEFKENNLSKLDIIYWKESFKNERTNKS